MFTLPYIFPLTWKTLFVSFNENPSRIFLRSLHRGSLHFIIEGKILFTLKSDFSICLIKFRCCILLFYDLSNIKNIFVSSFFY